MMRAGERLCTTGVSAAKVHHPTAILMPSPYVQGNLLTLFPDGDDTFLAMLAAVAAARERVWLETYTFEPDEAGLHILAALEGAARRGCDVILIVDRFGSMGLRDRHFRALRDAGGHAVWFNPLVGHRIRGRKVSLGGGHRDHRKIFVIDDDVAFCGGKNVSLDYTPIGLEDDAFFDVMVRVEGPLVRDLAAALLETLGDASDLARELFAAAPPAGDVPARALTLDRREKDFALDQALLDLVENVERELLFCTPYFLPPRPLLHAIEAAARRGVDVRILTAGRSDVPAVKVAGRFLYRRLLAAGARVFEMCSHPLHAKFYVADGQSSIVGSYNADRWGRRYNQEVAVQALSAELATKLGMCFEWGAEQEVTLDVLDAWSPVRRTGQAALYGISRLLAPEVSRVAGA
jgi:cardiolipin synthase A/B